METPNTTLHSISKQFLVFGRGSELFFYNFRDRSEQSFNLSDVLSDVDFNTKIDNFNILALSTYSNTNKVTKSESSRNKSEDSDIFVTVFLSNGFIVLLKHDTQLKYHFHHHILSTTYPQNVTVEHTGETVQHIENVETVKHTENVETREKVLVSTIRVNDWYSFYVLGGVLYLLSWSRDRTVKLHDGVLHFSLCTSQDKLLLVLENSMCLLTVDELFLSNCLHSPDPHLDDSHMEQLIDISTSGLNNILVSNKLVFLLYKEELWYSFLNKLSLYRFTPVLNVTFFNFQTVSDINLVLTIDTEYTVVIYDYDTVNTVLTLKHTDLVSNTEGQSGEMRYNVCVLCDDMSLLLFDNENLVHSVKLQLQDDKLVLPNDVNSVTESTETLKDIQSMSDKRNLEGKEKEKEEERYKKLKSIRRNRFLDLEAVEFEDPPPTHTTVHTMEDSIESNSQLSKASQDKETATTGTGADVGEMGEGEYDIENYGYNAYGTENLMYLVSEMKKLKRKVKQLEYLAMPKEHKILTPGLSPKPNDQFKQWCLFWNEYGHISKQNNLENNNLQIYLFSGPLSGYIKKVDRFSCQMASLHLDGLVCGTNIFSSHPKDTQDHTHDITKDIIQDNGSDVPVDNVQKKVGVVYYYNLYNNNENWDRRFPNEEIKAVSISSNYIAVVTHLNILYLLTRNNMLLNVSKLKGTIVSLLTNKNMLVVVTQIITNTHDTVYNVNILWINGIKGLTHNNTLKIITLYNDLLILNHTHIKHIGLSNEYVLWYMDSKYKLWLLINNIKNINNNDILEWIPTTNVNSNYYPLYINNFNLYYIKLRSGERYPNCGKNINFFGYTLHNLSITLNTETNTIINTHKGGNLRTEGASIGIDSSVFINTKLQVPESILENNIDIYDELRYLQNININQLQYIINIIQLYNYWYIQSENSVENTGHTIDKNEINKYLSNINIFEKNHDKLLLRILAKIQSTNKLYKNVDIIQMLKIPKCLEIAKTIVTNDRYRKLINESLILLQKSMTLNK